MSRISRENYDRSSDTTHGAGAGSLKDILTLGVTRSRAKRQHDTVWSCEQVSSAHRVKLGDMVNVPCLSRMRTHAVLPQHIVRGDPDEF